MAIQKSGRWIFVILGILSLASGFWISAIGLRAPAQVAEHAREVAEGAVRLSAQPRERPVLWDVPVPGNAWDTYAPLFQLLVDAISDEGWNQIRRAEGHPFHKNIPVDEAALNTALESAKKIIAPLREGFRRTRVDVGFGFRGPGFNDYGKKTMAAEMALEVLALLLAQEHERGDDASALDLADLLLGVAQDVSRGCSIEGASYSARAEAGVLVQCANLFSSWNAAPVDLRRFLERLEALEKSRPSLKEIWFNDDLYHRAALLDEEDFQSSIGEQRIRPGWRCLFSTTVMKAQALNLCRSGYQRLMDASALPQGEQERVATEIEHELKGHPNGVVFRYLNFEGEDAAVLWSVPQLLRERSDNLMHWALLRTATSLALFEAEHGKGADRLEDLVPMTLAQIPTCPLSGQPVRLAPGRIWLPGRNGVDDGGIAADPDEYRRYSGGEKDIVWRVQRKRP